MKSRHFISIFICHLSRWNIMTDIFSYYLIVHPELCLPRQLWTLWILCLRVEENATGRLTSGREYLQRNVGPEELRELSVHYLQRRDGRKLTVRNLHWIRMVRDLKYSTRNFVEHLKYSRRYYINVILVYKYAINEPTNFM